MSSIVKQEDLFDLQEPDVQVLLQRSRFNRFIAGDVFHSDCGPGERWTKFLKLPADVHAAILEAPSTSQEYELKPLNGYSGHGCIWSDIEDEEPGSSTGRSDRYSLDMAGQRNATINPALLMSRKDEFDLNMKNIQTSGALDIQQPQQDASLYLMGADKDQANAVDNEAAVDDLNVAIDHSLPCLASAGGPQGRDHAAFLSLSILSDGQFAGDSTGTAPFSEVSTDGTSSTSVTSENFTSTIEHDAAFARMLAQVWQSEDLGPLRPLTRSNRSNQSSSTATELPQSAFEEPPGNQKAEKKPPPGKRAQRAVKSSDLQKRSRTVSKNTTQGSGAPRRMLKTSKRCNAPVSKVTDQLQSYSTQILKSIDQNSDSESLKQPTRPELTDDEIGEGAETIGRPHRRFGAKGLTLTSSTGEKYFQEANISRFPSNHDEDGIPILTKSRLDARQSFDGNGEIEMEQAPSDGDSEDLTAMEVQFDTTEHRSETGIKSAIGLKDTPLARHISKTNARAGKILKKKYSKKRTLPKGKQIKTELASDVAKKNKKRKNPPWSEEEYEMLYRGLKCRRDYEASNEDVRKPADVSFWSVVLENLYAQGLSRTRTCSAARFFWSRQGRARSGFDERQNKSPVLVTCVQSSKKTKVTTTRPHNMRSTASRKARNNVGEESFVSALRNVEESADEIDGQSAGQSGDDEQLDGDETEDDGFADEDYDDLYGDK